MGLLRPYLPGQTPMLQYPCPSVAITSNGYLARQPMPGPPMPIPMPIIGMTRPSASFF
jgi:hypothetical protein